jgi:hypothetical protein
MIPRWPCIAPVATITISCKPGQPLGQGVHVAGTTGALMPTSKLEEASKVDKWPKAGGGLSPRWLIYKSSLV